MMLPRRGVTGGAGFDQPAPARAGIGSPLELRMLVIDEFRAMLSGTFREQRIFLNRLRFWPTTRATGLA